MKKFLPIILFVLGALVLVGVYFFTRNRNAEPQAEEEEEEIALLNVPLAERPVLTLTPRSDGYWLDMKLSKIMIDGAESLDYELLYDLPDGRQQGVPGTVQLSGLSELEAELLLGSESSGRFRYDEGVETGTLTLRFRNSDGRLLAKFIASFRLLSNTTELSTADGKFKVGLDKEGEGFFVLMETVGYPGTAPSEVKSGPYGFFASDSEGLAGDAEILGGSVRLWNGSEWTEEVGGDALSTGVYIGI